MHLTFIIFSTRAPDNEYTCTEYKAVLHHIKYECCPLVYPDVTFIFVLKRRALYYIVNLLIPCLLVSTLGVVTFLLSPDAGERISLSE